MFKRMGREKVRPAHATLRSLLLRRLLDFALQAELSGNYMPKVHVATQAWNADSVGQSLPQELGTHSAS